MRLRRLNPAGRIVDAKLLTFLFIHANLSLAHIRSVIMTIQHRPLEFLR